MAAPAPGWPTALPMIAPLAAPMPPPSSVPFSRVLSGCEHPAKRISSATIVTLACAFTCVIARSLRCEKNVLPVSSPPTLSLFWRSPFHRASVFHSLAVLSIRPVTGTFQQIAQEGSMTSHLLGPAQTIHVAVSVCLLGIFRHCYSPPAREIAATRKGEAKSVPKTHNQGKE